ncbi:hypothetical protein ACXDIJ_000320 [Klebsiella quasipneumoniae]
MTKSTITREQVQKIIVAADEVITALAGTNEDVHPDDSKKMCELWDDLNDRHAPPVVVRELARMALAAMDSKPQTDDELSNLLWYSQEATCHSDPNYYCEFQRLATPGLIAGIIRELQERRKADSEPVAEVLSNRPGNDTSTIDRALPVGTQLYRHAQTAPVVSSEVLNRLEHEANHITAWHHMDEHSCKVSRRDLLTLVSACRAAMLEAGTLTNEGAIQALNSPAIPDGYVMVPKEPTKQMILAGQEELESCIDNGFDSDIDGNRYDYTDIVPDTPHRLFMAMLAAAPQEPKP